MKATRRVIEKAGVFSVPWGCLADDRKFVVETNERLIIESGPDPVEMLRKVYHILEGQGYVMPQTFDEIKNYLAALGEE